MKRNQRAGAKVVSRRDTLKVCLIPAGIVATRLLAACSTKKDEDAGNPNDTQAGSNAAPGQAGTGVNTQASGGSTAGAAQSTAGSQAQPQAGSQAPGGAGSGAPMDLDAGGNDAQIADGGSTAADSGMSEVAGPGVPWATGGTTSLTSDYPDPFEGGNAGTACALYPAQTIGPCYADGPMNRKDISDGLDGLPMRVSLRVVQADGCTPVPDANVDIWHSGSQGIYSAFAMGTICNPGSDDVMNEMFCRGVQVTDADGRVDFDTIFPGWYTGRAIHIHFTVRVGNQEYVTSQLYFDDALSDEIGAQGLYAARGVRDTTNSNDFIFASGGGSPADVIFETVKRPDGVLHAWKLLTVS